jgi:hypothetical protein
MTAKRKAPKRKPPERKPPEIAVPVELDPFEEYGNSSPHNLTHKIRSEIDDGNRELEDLVDAIHAIDQYDVTNPRPDKKPLIKLLMSRGTTPPENKLLADWIDRKVPPTRAGRPRRPVYTMSHDDRILSNACGDVEELRGGGLSVANAITQVAKERGIPRSKLADFRDGRRRSRRKKK